MQAPFNLKNWINENRSLLKPPIGNTQIYKGNADFIVMVVGGPNARKDFHINESEELFYQLEGDIMLELMVKNPEGIEKKETLQIKEGDLFLLPPGLPHGPRRGPGTVGLVVERYRKPGTMDGFAWYCENCQNLLYKGEVEVSDIVNQLPVLMSDFFDDPQKCTCSNCHTKMEKPLPIYS